MADPMAEDELDELLKVLDKRIMNGIALSVALDKDFDTDGMLAEAKEAIVTYTTNKIIEALEDLLLQFRRLPMPESQRDVIIIEFVKALNHRKDE